MRVLPPSIGETRDNSDRDRGEENWKNRGGESFKADRGPRSVDREQIRQFHAGVLDRHLELEIRDLIISYRDWANASREILIESLKSEPGAAGDTNSPQIRPQ